LEEKTIYDRIAIAIIEEVAKQTIFSEAALKEQDAREMARRSSRRPAQWLRVFQRKAEAVAVGCDTALQPGLHTSEGES